MTVLDENRGDDIELIGATINDQDFIAHAREDIPNIACFVGIECYPCNS